MPDTKPKPSTALLTILGLLVILGLLIAWEAMNHYAKAIAAVYATAAILAAAALLSLLLVRVAYGMRRSRRDHTLDEAKVKARHMTIATETSLAQAEAMSRARQLSAAARKAEREAELTTIIAKRDEQVLISDDNPRRKFTAAHLQLSGQVNGVQITATPEQIAAWSAFHSPRSQAAAAVFQEQPTPPAELPPIIPALVNRQRILIVGASDAGKTTLLRWLIEARGKCLVIDPQGSPGKWGAATMLGEGLNYPLIASTLDKLAGEMKRRHEEIGTGEILEGQHEHLTIIIDDLRGIIMNCKGIGLVLAHLLTDGRSTGLNLVIGTHSKYVKPLGLEGEGDLRKGFVIVELNGGNGEQWSASLEFNADGNKIPHRSPGPHPNIEAAKLKAQAAETIETDLEAILQDMPEPEPEPTSNGFDPDQAAAIREMAANGISKPDIARKLGYDNYGGSIFYQIKQALQGA
ncbi:MAG TPA: hypothetical protein ENH62_09405 [Marinobacter sp.]|nr:hypothetical protein [Marinobacter sp.]